MPREFAPGGGHNLHQSVGICIGNYFHVEFRFLADQRRYQKGVQRLRPAMSLDRSAIRNRKGKLPEIDGRLVKRHI